MVVLKENCCRICKKVFCCLDCRITHENSKHSKPKCNLCIKEDLPYKPTSELSRKNSELVCHVVFNHLPVYCKLCGEKFTSNEELIKAQSCRYWAYVRRLNLLRTSQSYVKDVNSIIEYNSDNPQTDIEIRLPLTPPPYTDEEVYKSSCIPNSNVILRLKVDSLDSPPELTRHTSTPMHGIAVPGQKLSNQAALQAFLIKTPLSFDQRTFDSTESMYSKNGSSGSESQYYSLSVNSDVHSAKCSNSITTNNNSNQICENQADPLWNRPSYPILKKNLESNSAEISNKKERHMERNIMKSEVLGRISRINDTSSNFTEKRVRFSDQHVEVTTKTTKEYETVDESSTHTSDNDIYFEALETLDQESNLACSIKFDQDTTKFKTPEMTYQTKSELSADSYYNKEKVHSRDNTIYSSISCKNSFNEYNNKNNNNDDDKKDLNTADATEEENKLPSSTPNISSKVIMMLLVGKSDAKGLFSSKDLTPLIDSQLKKLDQTFASASESSNIENRNGSQECKGVLNSSKFTAEWSDIALAMNNSFGTNNDSEGKYRNCNSSTENFVSITEKVECYTGSSKIHPKQSEEVNEKYQMSNQVNNSNNSNGLFSVVARVVRCALNKLPAVTSVTGRDLSREPMTQTAIAPINLPSSPSFSIASTEVLIMDPCAKTTSKLMLERSHSKRPRDRIDSTEEQLYPAPREISGSSKAVSPEMISSPAAKRHRGWSRIRAREPIARMRARPLASPRGTSRETQRFQQGFLTVGDTLLPLPSRAHQSTQTDDQS